MQSTTLNQPDLEAVREMLVSLVAEGRSGEAIEAAVSMLSQLRHLNTELLLRVAQMQRERSGRRSERIDPAQLSLLLELCRDQALEDAADEEPDDEDLWTARSSPSLSECADDPVGVDVRRVSPVT